MPNEIISYVEMCLREGMSLQRGMNFRMAPAHSVVLMSVRKNAPYRDRFDDDGSTIVYEGHDIRRVADGPDPKAVDQPEYERGEKLSQNGHFHAAAQRFRRGDREAARVKVYEKIHQGIWSYNGLFALVDSWRENDGRREVFRFRLTATPETDTTPEWEAIGRRRVIPTSVKLEVWKRDRGQCVICGAHDELHFDHEFPYSLGGTSLSAKNVQLLCARHNLSKGAKIQ